MFTVSVKTHFWASHQLTLPDGAREQRHQHNWIVTAEVSRGKLDKIGRVADFQLIKKGMKGIVAELDNRQLEMMEYFKKNNASAENVAKYIYEKLAKKLPKELKLRYVRVEEQEGCAAKFGK